MNTCDKVVITSRGVFGAVDKPLVIRSMNILVGGFGGKPVNAYIGHEGVTISHGVDSPARVTLSIEEFMAVAAMVGQFKEVTEKDK